MEGKRGPLRDGQAGAQALARANGLTTFVGSSSTEKGTGAPPIPFPRIDPLPPLTRSPGDGPGLPHLLRFSAYGGTAYATIVAAAGSPQG